MNTSSNLDCLGQLISDFVLEVANNRIEIYNEFSLQHELGIFLRAKLLGHKIQFERNISHFNAQPINFCKKEIDITIISPSGGDRSVIELKYPRNGQVPESMFSFCKDIVFLEQLISAGFKSAYFVAFADSPLFYSGRSEGIYGLFRDGIPITGVIQKPTGARDTEIQVNGSYIATWCEVAEQTKYCMIEVAA